MAKRKSNEQVCEEFRALLTEGAKVHFDADMLEKTKGYRGDIWKAFREIEDRMLPLKRVLREREENGNER